MIHIWYKNIQLLPSNTDKHSYDSSYLLSIYHTSTEVKYFYTFYINHTHNMFFHSIHLTIQVVIRLAGHVVHMGGGEVHVEFWWGNQRERNSLENLGIGGRAILK
jgi:hypothetical protein